MFKRFDFTFTPPPTVLAPINSSSSTPTDVNTSVGANSNAGQLISKLDQLISMSQYLQSVILSRTGKMAIEINPAVDPNMSRALTSVYGTDTPPTFITISMYNQLLDAHLGALQLEMSVGNDSEVQANPIQVADLMTIINTLDSHLTDSVTYKTWLPLQLASLKGDAVLFQSWRDSLATYPAFYVANASVSPTFQPGVIQAAQLDISPDLGEYENTTLEHFGQSYSNLYQSLANPHPVERDINSVMNEYFNQPLQNMLRIVSLFSTLKGLVHKPSMDDLVSDLVNYSFIRLASDVTGMLHTFDQLVSMAVKPLKGALGSIGKIVSGVQQQAAEIGWLTSGGLSGLSKTNADAQTNPYNKIKGAQPLNIPGLGAISDGLKYLGENLDWSVRESERGLSIVDKSFRQLMERRMKSQDDRNQLMGATRAMDSLLGVAKGVVNEVQKGTVTSNSNLEQKQEAANRILASLQVGSDTTFTTNDNEIITNPSDMPPPPPGVILVLSRADIRTTSGALEI